MFRRIAIVNRGEAAMRLVHAVRDLNDLVPDPADPKIETIALFTDGERGAMFVREADHAYGIGPAAARPYLDHAVLERALRETGADAAWVGWGFVAEDPAFADLCDGIGVTFIGPSGDAMRRLGDKIGAKQLAEQVGVPVAPWSDGPVEDLEAALRNARRIGYPLMLKAAAGGGGRGIRVVTSDAELAAVFDRTRDEAGRAFGSGVVFLEKLVTGARHVEVQLISHPQGTAWALGVRDCSVQRRHQKLIEESSSPLLGPDQEQLVKESAARLAVAVGYRGAATAEFLYQPDDRAFSFLEVNTRLQVEHPVTELTSDVDLVRLQLHVAAGGRLDGPVPPASGHAVEARLNAEDPDRDFAPAPGRIALFQVPVGPGVRIDTGVAAGDVIPADFDSMIAKIIAYGPTREDALARLRRALTDTTVVIEGGTTNKSFLLDLLARPEVVQGSADTGWIDRERTRGGLAEHAQAGVALVAAGIEAYDEAERAERFRFLATAHGGRPEARHALGRSFDLKLRGATHKVEVAQVGPHRYRVLVDGSLVDAIVEQLHGYTIRLTVEGHSHRVVTATHAAVHLVEVDGRAHRVTKDEGGVLRAPAPALVVSVPVGVGDEVGAGAPVAVLESMKMETVVPAPFPARVKELLVVANEQVGAGQPLLRLEPVGDDDAGPVDETPQTRPELPTRALVLDDDTRALRLLADLESMILGYDVRPDDGRHAAAAYQQVHARLDDHRRELLGAELAVLTIFADLCELTRNRPHAAEGADDRVHSPREYFHSYLHSLDVERERLPEDFRAKLGRVLAHYGVDGLDRSDDLEEAVFRVFLAQQRTQSHLPVVTTLLQRWLAEQAPSDGISDRAREVLDRLVVATQLRFPAIGDLARSARFRWFEAPIVEAARQEAYAGVRDQLGYLSAHPGAPDYEERVEALVASPEPLVRFLAERISQRIPAEEPLVEVLARRHYREHDLLIIGGAGGQAPGDRPCLVGDYAIHGGRTRLVTTIATDSEFAPGTDLVRSLTDVVEATPGALEAVVDLYLSWPDAPTDPDAAAAELADRVAALPWVRRLRRIAIMATARGGALIHQFTFRPDSSGGVAEDALVRRMHPMVGRRLDLWRLRDFTLTRLPSPEDVLLYHCVAPGNEADQRLVALAQVRELSVVRDAAGHVVSLPQAERAIASCLDAIRRARAGMRNGARLDMNHVWLYIWPVIDTPVEELTALKATIAPLTVGAGIEEVTAQGRIARPGGPPVAISARFSYQPGSGVVARVSGPPKERLRPLDDYAQKVLRSRRRGTVYPYELVPLLTRDGGTFVEHDLDDGGRLVPVERAPGGNKAGLVVGVVRTPTVRYPEGMTRVVLLGDPTRSLGAVAEPECLRVVAALDLAAELGVPLEWFALSSGARISMDNGTENMDWVARALRRIVEFTQGGGEINVIVTGINVGAQPYWNAEATMLMHTKGILVMTPDSAMVLTGKQSLDYSGGVSAEDNFGIGGYDRVMGPNGQAQYWAGDLAGAVDVLFQHYEHSYVAPGEAFPRPAPTSDPRDRDVRDHPHEHPDSPDFRTVGDIFSPRTNPERKKAFDIRTLMRAVADQDHPTLERWAGMADAETAVVLDAHLGGHPVCLLGVESRPVPRRGFPPSDGPDTWTAGTLFPQSSKKAARAINAASGSRPLVVLANLSGFDGSPESMRRLQLEYGAEIGRAVVNFAGPIVFCVVSRYHGGAFVVFSKTLNDAMEVLAVDGSYASVIGGAPAAGVVFTGEVDARTRSDPRVSALERRLADGGQQRGDAERGRLLAELAEVRAAVRSEKLGEVAAEFDAVHSIERAVAVGSVDEIISAAELRPRLIDAVERGLATPRPR
ncbi:MAG TPA: carboxyl transferase domain-containing protein [Kineosporiaceae bacterium]|nr:carboxyl transferase domain-containing protein [Kineosporiaceae bacterium]